MNKESRRGGIEYFVIKFGSLKDLILRLTSQSNIHNSINFCSTQPYNF